MCIKVWDFAICFYVQYLILERRHFSVFNWVNRKKSPLNLSFWPPQRTWHELYSLKCMLFFLISAYDAPDQNTYWYNVRQKHNTSLRIAPLFCESIFHYLVTKVFIFVRHIISSTVHFFATHLHAKQVLVSCLELYHTISLILYCFINVQWTYQIKSQTLWSAWYAVASFNTLI